MTEAEGVVASFWRDDEFKRFRTIALVGYDLPEDVKSCLTEIGIPRTRHRFQWSFRFTDEPQRVLRGGTGYVVVGGDDHSLVGLKEPTGEVYVLPRRPEDPRPEQYANSGITSFVAFITLFEQHLERIRSANFDRQVVRESADLMLKKMDSVDASALAARTDFWRIFLSG